MNAVDFDGKGKDPVSQDVTRPGSNMTFSRFFGFLVVSVVIPVVGNGADSRRSRIPMLCAIADSVLVVSNVEDSYKNAANGELVRTLRFEVDEVVYCSNRTQQTVTVSEVVSPVGFDFAFSKIDEICPGALLIIGIDFRKVPRTLTWVFGEFPIFEHKGYVYMHVGMIDNSDELIDVSKSEIDNYVKIESEIFLEVIRWLRDGFVNREAVLFESASNTSDFKGNCARALLRFMSEFDYFPFENRLAPFFECTDKKERSKP